MKSLTVLALLLATAGAPTAASQPGAAPLSSSALWRLVARSSVVVEGELRIPVEEIRSAIDSGQGKYVDIRVVKVKPLLGSVGGALTVRWFSEPGDHAPSADTLLSLAGQRALLFLAQVDDPGAAEFHFAGYTRHSLAVATDANVRRARKEIEEQRRILSLFAEEPIHADPLAARVKDLIDATTGSATQREAFRELEKLGPSAVPAIIRLMDDRRDLATPWIELENHSEHAFEGVRQYGPKKVVDAVAAILGQVTGESFGTIYNGGSERERRRTVDAWRVYLHHLESSTL